MLLDKLWADMLCLDRFDTDEWCYVGEGNANIVMRYTGSEQKLVCTHIYKVGLPLC